MQSTIFETEQFTIRELQPSDLAAFHEMQGNIAVMRYTTGKATTLEEDQVDLAKVIEHYQTPNNLFWVWAIEHKIDKTFLGTCALIGDKKGIYEIGFRFLEKYWGKGYGKETANALIDYAFCQEVVKGLIAYVDVRNKASISILEQSKLGFIEEMDNEELKSRDRFYKMEIVEVEGEIEYVED